jgi:hypothetical protein
MHILGIWNSIKYFFKKIFGKKKKSPSFEDVVFASTISNDIVTVQPMSGIPYEPDNVYTRRVITEKYKSGNYINLSIPSGILYYLDFKYGKTENDAIRDNSKLI